MRCWTAACVAIALVACGRSTTPIDNGCTPDNPLCRDLALSDASDDMGGDLGDGTDDLPDDLLTDASVDGSNDLGDRGGDGQVCAAHEICGNQIDDDCNGLTDCQDPSCRTQALCIDHKMENCRNGIDDDLNG